jgi:hypothetical protein
MDLYEHFIITGNGFRLGKKAHLANRTDGRQQLS